MLGGRLHLGIIGAQRPAREQRRCPPRLFPRVTARDPFGQAIFGQLAQVKRAIRHALAEAIGRLGRGERAFSPQQSDQGHAQRVSIGTQGDRIGQAHACAIN